MRDIKAKYTSIRQALSQPDFTERFNSILSKINGAAGQSRVTSALHEAVDLMGFDGGAFLSFIRSDESRESFKFTVACSPVWCQKYSENAWYQIDPGLMYAQMNSAPSLIEDLPVRSSIQREILNNARDVGFVSGIVVPTHSPGGRNRMGVLYLGSAVAGYVDAQTLQDLKLYVKAISSDMLEWWIKSMREQLIKQVQITDKDLHLMRLVQQGYRSKGIAELLQDGHSANTIDQRIGKLCARIHADGRKDAVQKLMDVGLLS